LRPNSTESYRVCLKRLQRDHDAPVQGLDFRTIEAWLDGLGVSASTRAHYLAFLAGFYRWAVRHDIIVGNPVDKIDRPRQQRRLPRPISEADLTRALDHADPRMRAWLTLAAYQGLRIQEIAGLDADDVLLHLDPPLLRVSKGKGAEERMLPLNPLTEKALRDWGIPHTGCVFPNRYGRPVHVGLTSPRGTMRERTPGVWELRAYTCRSEGVAAAKPHHPRQQGRCATRAGRARRRGRQRPHRRGFRTWLLARKRGDAAAHRGADVPHLPAVLGHHRDPTPVSPHFASEVYDVTRDSD
jgi:integrase